MKKTLLAWVLMFVSFNIMSQQTLKGKIVDEDNNSPIIGATIKLLGTTNATVTDVDGNFSLKNVNLPATIVISSIGYDSKEIKLNDLNEIKISLKSSSATLDAVTVVGSRFAERTSMTTPVPIDVISAKDLISSGQPTVDKMLVYKVPSYNSTQQPISDATAAFDPADLRGMGPSRTLVLINGKRKNASAQVYINDTPGKGEVGVDMRSIPAYAIERIEVLRDGASAQYGSDAIAGVINVVLKKNIQYSTINLFTGVTSKGDGGTYGVNINTGTSIGKGFLNITADFADQKATNRPGTSTQELLIGGFPLEQNAANQAWEKANPGLGSKFGQPNMTTRDIFYNFSMPVGENGFELYSFGGVTNRNSLSYALYRMPYWPYWGVGANTVVDPNNIFHQAGTTYQGFQPTFGADILDKTFAVGGKGTAQGWKYDISYTSGSNEVDYKIGNTFNPSMGAASPTNFYGGGYKFSSNVTNFDIGKQFGILLLGFGAEFRNENFIAKAGEEASYINGGAQSFPGLQPSNAVNAKRNNVGFYTDINLDVTKDLLIGAAARHETYSDFGDNFSWKINGRYKFWNDKIAIRASYSTGFRAPSLHQIYMSNVQTLVSGGTISNQGTFNNESAVVRSLGVEKLKAETSTNFTAGITINPIRHLNIALDYYNIKVDNRIVYSSSISSSDATTAVGKILAANNVTSLKFFTNAVNTQTKGMDVVASYSNINLGKGKLSFVISANFNHITLDPNISTPSPIASSNAVLFDRKEQSRITTARPNSKILLGINYSLEKTKIALNNTRFGEVTWRHADNGLNSYLGHDDAYFDQTFAPKLITDLNVEHKFSKTFTGTISVNNIFDIYPDLVNDKGDFVTTLSGRFKYPWEVNQGFGINGRTYMAALKINL